MEDAPLPEKDSRAADKLEKRPIDFVQNFPPHSIQLTPKLEVISIASSPAGIFDRAELADKDVQQRIQYAPELSPEAGRPELVALAFANRVQAGLYVTNAATEHLDSRPEPASPAIHTSARIHSMVSAIIAVCHLAEPAVAWIQPLSPRRVP